MVQESLLAQVVCPKRKKCPKKGKKKQASRGEGVRVRWERAFRTEKKNLKRGF